MKVVTLRRIDGSFSITSETKIKQKGPNVVVTQEQIMLLGKWWVDSKEYFNVRIKTSEFLYAISNAGRIVLSMKIQELPIEERTRVINEIVLKMEKVERIKTRITIGADPEFEVYSLETGRVQDAESIIGYLTQDIVGTDGFGCQLELRPEPAATVKEFLKNYKKALQLCSERLPKRYSISATGNDYSLGGHIHIGFKDFQNLRNVIEIHKIVEVIDDFIGFLADCSGKSRGNYRQRKAYELKAWGFEYRTLPACIFSNREILRIILKLITGILREFFKKGIIEYELEGNRASINDFKRFLTEKEIEKLFEFYSKIIERVSEDQIIDVFSAFKIRKIKMQPYYVFFNDDWDEKHKAIFKTAIDKRLKNYKGKTVRIYLYGLRKDRGLVATLSYSKLGIETAKNLPLAIYEKGGFNFGIPRALRVSENGSLSLKQAQEYANFLADALYNLLIEKGGENENEN